MANSKNLSKRVPFKKNDPRINRKGRPEKIPALDELLKNVLGVEARGVSVAEQIIKALVRKAKKGDVRAAEVLLERAYGKVKQHTELSAKMDLKDFSWDEIFKPQPKGLEQIKKPLQK